MLLRRSITASAVCILGALVLTSCVGEVAEEPTVSRQSSEAPSPGAVEPSEAAAPGTVDRSVPYGAAELEVSVHPLVSDGEQSVLTVDYTLSSDTSDDVTMGLVLADADVDYGNTGVRLVDPERRTILPVARTAEGETVASKGPLSLAPGKTVTVVSVHAAPTGDSIDVLLPSLGVTVGVPVVEGDVPAAVPDDLPVASSRPVYDLRSFTSSYDEVVTTRVEDREVTLSLTSDVLFATGESSLSAQAQAAISKAVRQLKESADGGEVRVIGHTDDVDSDEVNQKLSEERAAAVSKVLSGTLGDGFRVTAEGRGEREPLVPGTDDAARAANRRVELVFAGHDEVEVTESSGGGIPEATVPVGSGTDPVEYEPLPGRKMTVSAVSVVRRGGVLVGTLRLEAGSEMAGAVPSQLGEYIGGVSGTRGFDEVDRVGGAHELVLLGAEGATYPLDYLVEEDDGESRRRLTGDERLVGALHEPGDVMIATVLWPDNGEDAVTIEARNRFRLVDVPVTEG